MINIIDFAQSYFNYWYINVKALGLAKNVKNGYKNQAQLFLGYILALFMVGHFS